MFAIQEIPVLVSFGQANFDPQQGPTGFSPFQPRLKGLQRIFLPCLAQAGQEALIGGQLFQSGIAKLTSLVVEEPDAIEGHLELNQVVDDR